MADAGMEWRQDPGNTQSAGRPLTASELDRIAGKHLGADNRPWWTKAVERIEGYWSDIVGRHGPAGQFCIALSVFALGVLFALAMPWFITVSLKRAIIG